MHGTLLAQRGIVRERVSEFVGAERVIGHGSRLASQPVTDPASPSLDHRGGRRLGRREELFWYALAAVSYVSLGIYHKWLLNWIVGPLWLVATVAIGPAILDRIRRRNPSGDDL
jgi:hypothetical protein